MIKSYWLRLVLFAGVGAILALGLSMLVPKKYEAVLDILIDQKPIVGSVPMNNAEQSVADLVDFGRSRTLTTQVQQLTSFGVIMDAARRVAQQRNEPDPMTTPDSPIYPPSLMDSITVTAEATSDIIGLKIRLTDPELAKDVAREINVAFNDRNNTNTRELASRAIQFLEQQIDDIDKQLKAVDSETEKVKLELGLADMATQIASETQNLNSIKNTRDSALLDLVTARQRSAELKKALEAIDKSMNGGDTKVVNPLYQKLEGELLAAKNDLNTLSARYLSDREEVVAAKARVENYEKQLKTTPEYIEGQSVTVPNSSRTALVNAVAEAQALEAGLEARVENANRIVDEKQAFMSKLPPAQSKLASLNRQTLALERVYQGYADRLKTLKAAQTGRLTPVREQTPATALPDPVSPKIVVNMLFGIVAGTILGVLSMLATESKRQPIRSLAQLNQLAFKPVYRLVPELRTPFRGLSKAPQESYETLLANHLRSSARPYRLAVVGLTKDSGASTAVINLAVAGARHGSRVLVVECDPRGGLARLAGRQPSPSEVVDISPLIRGMSVESFLGLSGDRSPEVSPQVRDQEADLTIIDLEPTSKSAEYAFIAPHVDEVVLLVRAGKTKSVEFLQAQQALKEAGCRLVTVAFTRSSDLAVVTESADPSLLDRDDSNQPKPLDA